MNAPSNSRSTGAATNTLSFALVMVALCLCASSAQLGISMLNPAVPNVALTLNTSLGAVGIAQTMFFAAAAISQVVMPVLLRLGRRRSMLVLLALQLVGNLIAAAAPNIGVFTVGRVLQGVSGGCLPLSFISLRALAPRDRFGQWLGVLLMVNLGVGGLDNIVGGYIAQLWSFRAIFVAITGVTAAALVLAHRAIPESTRQGDQGRVDWVGLAVLSVGVTSVLAALSQTGSWGWSSPITLACLVGGVTLIIGFVAVERRVSQPLIRPEHLLSRRTLPLIACTVLTLAGFTATYAFTLPVLSQGRHVGYGLDASTSALLYTAPAAALAFLCAPIAGRIADRIGQRRLLRVGLAVSVPTLIVVAAVPHQPLIVAAMLIIQGIFYFGSAQIALDGLGVLLSPTDSPGFLAGVNGACFALGTSLGIAVATGILGAHPSWHAYSVAIWVAAAFAVLSGLAAALIPSTR